MVQVFLHYITLETVYSGLKVTSRTTTATQYRTLSGYDCRNKCVFSFIVASDGADWMLAGSMHL